MLVLRFRIWFRYLFIILFVMLGIELSLFMPKEQAVRGAETMDVQTGGLVTVDLDSGTVTEYRRGLLLERYFAQEQLNLNPQASLTSANKNWDTNYVYQVDARGNITIVMEKLVWTWLWCPAACGIIGMLTVSLYQDWKTHRKNKGM